MSPSPRCRNDALKDASLGSISPTEKSEQPNLSGRNDCCKLAMVNPSTRATTDLLVGNRIESWCHHRVDTSSESHSTISHHLLSSLEIHDSSEALFLRKETDITEAELTCGQQSFRALSRHLLEHVHP